METIKIMMNIEIGSHHRKKQDMIYNIKLPVDLAAPSFLTSTYPSL